MRKMLTVGVALLVALLPLSAARAGEIEPEMLESILATLESVVGGPSGVDLEALELREHAGGVYSVAIPMAPETRDALRARSASASASATFKAMAIGHQLTEPDCCSVMITAADAIANRTYNFWLVVGNASDDDLSKRVTLQLKGPGDKFKVSDTFDFPAFNFLLLLLQAESGDVGFHTLQGKVAGGGKAKTIYFAQ